MDHLSSCYFCGAAMDVPVQDYRVVPVELRDDDAVTTATLCRSCHDKLERILAPVAAAAGESGATLDPLSEGESAPAGRQSPKAGRSASGTSRDTTTDDHEADASGPASPETPEVDAGTAESGTQQTGDAGETGAGDGSEEGDRDGSGGELVDVSGELIDVDDPLASGPSPDEEEGEAAGESADHDASESAKPDGAAGGTGDEPEAKRQEGQSDANRNGDETEQETEGKRATEGTDAGEPDAAARTTVSALEYNKVMRLLQNREFPVDRGEIQTIAANAYGLAESECAEVIDLAIDRGLIDERNGQLVRPD